MSLVRRGRSTPWAVSAARAGHALYRGFRVGGVVKRSFQGRNGNGSSNKRQKMMQRRGTNGVGVTREHDMRNVYRKRRMNVKGRRRWKKFVKKVDAVALKHQGTTSVVYNAGLLTNSAANFEFMFGIVLYGGFGITTAGQAFNSDMERLSLINRTSGVAFEPRNRSLCFKSAVLDLTVSNIGLSSVELDFYHFKLKKTTDQFQSLTSLVNDAVADTEIFEENATAAGPINASTLGATPFQFPAALKYITILKKTKVFVPVGGLSTYQMRLPGNRYWFTTNRNELQVSRPFGLKGWTQGIWVIQKGVPSLLNRADASDLSWSITRTYCMKTVDEDHVNLHGTFNA